MFAVHQASLFDVPLLDDATDGLAIGALDGSVQRTVLEHGAWVDHRPGWFTGSDQLFTELLDSVPWRSERRAMYDRVVDVPRLQCFFRDGEELPSPHLVTARRDLDRYYFDELREPFTTAGLCYYRDGADSVAWHGDNIGRSRTQDTMVAILSLGDARPLLLRPRGGGASLRFSVGHGDLLVMGGSCQRTWEHAVPKSSRPVGPRISVQFRPHDVR
ncbi:alpha-ketoglutarate-dependent dioxygenase AlkB [Antrihabitans cavernicola]|uniref:Alpha-ketoglutarate-dependent dioxygenase AlkB n=1 Tax=Antrihabitans cavernicola TaxID=2495913 RepID=A0A5A7S6V8_9NOCA|nr:alpha-ketoglutarate-dependent dioxygenase AlkB [Spelaeibacter cavernicola]KAA0021234.1 alpha-ketoglutarate-dependent dioxygenase AlkB [Spelaeibacter cavernicola]